MWFCIPAIKGLFQKNRTTEFRILRNGIILYNINKNFLRKLSIHQMLQKKSCYYLFVFLVFTNLGISQKPIDDQKVILITLDGLRWKELFFGADSLLVKNKKYVKNPEKLCDWFWSATPQERRSALMPFIWGQVIKMGQIHGNRKLGSKVNLTNGMWFSYPGYNEILTGRADDKNIYSNDKIPNPNETVLEQFAKAYGTTKVAAFGSWDVFDAIVNQERSGIYTNCGFEPSTDFPLTPQEELLNELQRQIPSPWGTVRLDGFTHQFAKAYLEKHQPDLIYIAYGETDDFAHGGDYGSYLKSTKNTDAMIEDLWNYTQKSEYYRGKTTFIITTDHGRGTHPIDSWRSHGTKIKGSDQTWILLFGKGVAPLGEVNREGQLYNHQIAATVRMLLGLPQKEDQAYGRPFALTP